MLFNAVSGCDSVPRCLSHGKKSAWLDRRSCPSAIDAFPDLSLQPVDVSSETLEMIDRFLVVVYIRMCSAMQWSMERVVGIGFSDNGEHPTNQSGIAATCATRGIANGVCVVTGATKVYTADAGRAAGTSANDVHRISSAQNSANVADHVATTCSISSLFVHDAHYYYVVM